MIGIDVRDNQLNSDGGVGWCVVWHSIKFMRENLYLFGSHFFLWKIFGCHILTITLKMHTQFDCVLCAKQYANVWHLNREDILPRLYVRVCIEYAVDFWLYAMLSYINTNKKISNIILIF